MARDLIAIMLDVPADSFALDVDVIMPAPVTALLAEAGKFTEQANHARPAGVSLRSWAQAPRRKSCGPQFRCRLAWRGAH